MPNQDNWKRSNSSSLAILSFFERIMDSSLNSVLIPSLEYITDKTESPCRELLYKLGICIFPFLDKAKKLYQNEAADQSFSTLYF